MKTVLLTVASVALSTGIVTNAYLQKKQFYPSIVYITKSNPSMAVLYVQALVFVILLGKLMGKIFFGQLRAAEIEHLIERSWYAVTETCLAFTVFRDDFSAKFVGLFTLLLFLKTFHWLAEDRIDYMERSPIIRWVFHFRAVALLAFLGILDLHFIDHAYRSVVYKGPSVQLVFGFEYAILFTVVITVFVKYVLHTIDIRSETPWLNKAVYMLYTSLILGLIKVLLYVAFLMIMIKVHTFPLFAIRPMYLTTRAFKKSLNDVIQSRLAIKNMNTMYPNATQEELEAGDNVCIICREAMGEGCKKLPCNHIFHVSCLRSWFLRQQTCPTCRMDILQTPASGSSGAAAAGRAAQQNGQQQQQQEANAAAQQQQQHQQQFMFHGMPNFVAPWFQQQPQPAPQGDAGAAAAATGATSATTTAAPSASSATTTLPPMFSTGTTLGMPTAGIPTAAGSSGAGMPASSGYGMLPFPPLMPQCMPPFMMPPPVPPADFSGLSDAQLSRMEGETRCAVETRLKVLRDIQSLLDAAVLQMNQYQSIVAIENFTQAATFTTQMYSGSVPSAYHSATSQPTSSAATATTTSDAEQPTSIVSSSSSHHSDTSNHRTVASSASTTEDTEAAKKLGAETGARPKTGQKYALTQPEGFVSEASHSQATSSQATSDNSIMQNQAPGDGNHDDQEDDINEMRRRRLQHFTSSQTKDATSDS